jgi:acetyl esterase/lipase
LELKQAGGDMPSKEFDNLIKLITSFPKKNALSFQERRADFEEQSKLIPVAKGTHTKTVQAGTIAAEWIIPGEASDSSVILYNHGGGYCVGSVNTHRSMASFIAKASKAKVMIIDYRLAPEYPFPAAIDDATNAYRWLLSNGSSPENIAIAGDSAGGGITVSMLVNLKKNDIPMPAAAVCLSPWVDLEMTGDSQKTKADLDVLIEKELLDKMAEAYVANADPKDPLVSPIYADLTGLPPMLIHAGTAEVLLDDARRLAERAEKAGVDVTLEIWDEMIHVFQYFAFMLPEGEAAIAKIAAFVHDHIGTR